MWVIVRGTSEFNFLKVMSEPFPHKNCDKSSLVPLQSDVHIFRKNLEPEDEKDLQVLIYFLRNSNLEKD